MGDVLVVNADTAQDTEHRLNEKRRLYQSAVSKVREVVKMSNVVALELKASLIGRTGFQCVFNVLEGVAKDQVATVFELLALPVLFELSETLKHGEEGKVEGTHIERCNFRSETHRRLDPFLDLHEWRTTTGQVKNGIGSLLDLG